MAIPVGFLGGVYLAEFGRDGRVATSIRMIANVVMGVPSIIVGVFAFAILVQPLHHYSGFAGSVALAFIMLPVMARTTEDILNLVPERAARVRPGDRRATLEGHARRDLQGSASAD